MWGKQLLCALCVEDMLDCHSFCGPQLWMGMIRLAHLRTHSPRGGGKKDSLIFSSLGFRMLEGMGSCCLDCKKYSVLVHLEARNELSFRGLWLALSQWVPCVQMFARTKPYSDCLSITPVSKIPLSRWEKGVKVAAERSDLCPTRCWL